MSRRLLGGALPGYDHLLAARRAAALGPLLLGAWLLLGCGAAPPEAAATPAEPAPPISYLALTLDVEPTWVGAVRAGASAFVVVEGERADGLSLVALGLSDNGGESTPLTRLLAGLRAPFGEPQTDGDALLVGGLRAPASGAAGPSLDLVRWAPGAAPERLLSCVLPGAVGGAFGIGGTELVVVFEAGGSLQGFRTSLAAPECPDEEALTPVLEGSLPDEYRLDWLDGQMALSGQWGESYAIQLYGPRFELLRRLRLASGTALDIGDLSFAAVPGEGWCVVYGARIEGARDVYLAPLGQLRAGPLEARRIVASAEGERQPRLLQHGGRTVVDWGVPDPSGGAWIEVAAVLSDIGSALPGGEVVWRRPVGPGLLATSLWTDDGLLRIQVTPGSTRSALTVTPYRPSFW